MSKLEGERIPDPIADDLRPALTQERVDQIWRDIALARAAGGAQSMARRVVRSPAFALAAAACVVLGSVVALRPWAPGAQTPVASQPLVRADGATLDVIAPSTEPAVVALSDGSELWVDNGAVLAPLDVSERSVVLHLVQGRARFAVKPGGPRRWVIEAGAASVEVVGTRFTVGRDAGGVGVEVQEGSVLVRGGALADGVVRLSAGEQVRVPAQLAVEAGPPPAQAITVETSVEPEQPDAPPSAVAPAIPKRAAQPAAPEPVPVTARPPDADALFKIADDARIARDYPGAIAALERVIRDHGGDPRAKLAAFTIGRIRDEHLRDLAGAVTAYETALALGLSGSLADDCYGRLLRALATQVREGRADRARWIQTARRYVQRYPKGRYAAEARRELDNKPAP